MSEPKFKVGSRVRVIYPFKGAGYDCLKGAIGIVVGHEDRRNFKGKGIGMWGTDWNYRVAVDGLSKEFPDGVLRLMETSIELAENGIERARRIICRSK